MKASQTLDTLGLFCPLPIILTSKKIKEMQPGQILLVLSDDVGVKKDMAVWCKNSGHELLQIVEENKTIQCWVRQRAEARTTAPQFILTPVGRDKDANAVTPNEQDG
ncbi:MAG: sulfurtransferase TusA family protein [Nitrospirota bacterium]